MDGLPAISVLKLLVLFVSANSSAESLLDIGGEVVVVKSSQRRSPKCNIGDEGVNCTAQDTIN